MPDNGVPLQSATPATLPAGTQPWLLDGTGSGDAGVKVAPTVLAISTGAEGSRTFDIAPGDTTNGIDVDVTRVQGTVAVSGPLTDSQLRAAAVPVSGPLTDAQMRASAVPVSGPLTDTQLRASNVPVSIGAALPAGTNAIGKLAANSGVDIGDVDVTSVTPGTAAANLGKAEDAAHASGDTGVLLLGVRNDALAARTSADGDYGALAITDKGEAFTRNADIGAPADAAASSDAGTFSLIALVKRLVGKLPAALSGGGFLQVVLGTDLRNKWAARVSLTLTSLASLANGSSWQSAAIDFGTSGATDCVLRFQLTGSASGTSVVNVFAAAALDDTTYVDGASGSAGSYSGTRLNARFVGQVVMNAATAVQGVLTLAQAFDGQLPQKVALILTNNSGAALAASGHTVEYQLVTGTAE